MKPALALVLFAFPVASVFGQITELQLRLTDYFNQDSNSAATFSYAQLSALTRIGSDSVSQITLTSSSVTPLSFTDESSYWFASTQAATENALSTAYPSGQYTFNFTGGSLDGTTHTGPIDYSLLSSHISAAPLLAGSSFDDLANIDVGSPTTLTFTTFDLPSQISSAGVQISIYQGTVSEYFSGDLSVGTTSVTIPADTFARGVAYNGSITFYVGTTPVDNVDTFYTKITNFTFTIPVPEPGAWGAMAGLVGLIAAGLSRRRTGAKFPS